MIPWRLGCAGEDIRSRHKSESQEFDFRKEGKVKTAVVKLLAKITYLNVVLTIIAVLLGIQMAQNMGFVDVRKAHANEAQPTDIMPVRIVAVSEDIPIRIEAVSGNIPVSIKGPLSFDELEIPIRIESVAGNVPVAIKDPIGSGGRVCTAACQW